MKTLSAGCEISFFLETLYNVFVIIFSSVLSWFRKRDVLLLELGNCFAKATILSISKGSTSILEERSFRVENYYNARIKDRASFVSKISHGLRKMEIPETVLVGIDSSHLTHKCFQVQESHRNGAILSTIEDKYNKKIIYSKFYGEKAAVLLMNRTILSELASALAEAGICVSKFVAIKTFVKGSGMREIIDIGYRTTNATIFEDDLLLSYKTIEIGMERILFSIAEKFDVSLEDARTGLEQTGLLEAEHTKWISTKEGSMNKKYLSSFARIYLEAFFKKVLGERSFDRQILLTGWANRISGINSIIKNSSFLSNKDRLLIEEKFI